MNLVLLALGLAVQQPQDTVVLKPVVVTATRVPMALDNVPAAVTVLRGADLATQGIRTVADALRLVPGASLVETGSFGGQTSLFMRGGESDYTKVMLDGVPLNQPGGAIDLAHLTTDNVDRIEIVRGPASVLYGSDAMTGVVQIFTKTGAATRTRLGGELRAGTYGSTDGAIDATGGTGKLTYSARISRFASSGLYPYNNDYRNSILSAAVKLTPDAQTAVNLTYRYGDGLYHFPTDGVGAPVDSNQRTAERGPALSLSAQRVMGAFELRILGAAKEAQLYYNDEPDSPSQDGTVRSHDYVRRASASAVLEWRPRATISVIGGLEFEDQRQRGMFDFISSGGNFSAGTNVERHNTGYFTEGVITAGPAVLTVGARLDDNSQFDTHATYRAGLAYRVLERMRLRGAVATGFKEPTFFENSARGPVTGNPYLDPERSNSWELGIEQSLAGNRGSVTVTYFDQRFRDLIEFDPAPPVGQPNFFNIAGAFADGVEAALVANVSRAVALSVRYTYLQTRVEQSASSNPDRAFVPGKPLIRRPEHTVTPELTATMGRAHVTVGGRWVGNRDDLDFSRPQGQQRVTLDPYTRVNVAAQYDVGRIVLSGRIENLFDDQSEEIAGYKPRGRTLLLGGRVAVEL